MNVRASSIALASAVVLLSAVATSCDGLLSARSVPSESASHESPDVSDAQAGVRLTVIEIREPPPDQPPPLTPLEVVERQVVFHLSDGSRRSPAASDVFWHKAWGRYATAVVRVPHAPAPQEEFIFMDERDGRWVINALVQGLAEPEGPALTDPGSVALPDHPFHIGTVDLTTADAAYRAWALEGPYPGVIVRYPWTAMVFGSDAMSVTIHDAPAYEASTGPSAWFVAYRDGKWLVVCGGSMTKREAEALAESLPPADTFDLLFH